MKRGSGPGPLSLENTGGGSEGRREGGAGQHQHQGWQTRGEPRSSASSQPTGVLGRSPLREAPAGNSKGNAKSKSLRPHEVPYARSAGSTADGEAAEKGVTLRCLYTHQKTKKRKTWSDGAVRCCPKRSRVSLYRWSDALGVTDKLLGEIYLTAPQYEAFVAQGEPELEMETFLVSLDGVIQPDDGPSAAGTTSSAVAGGAESAAAGGASGGAGGVGRKRKLFKAFKPPARRAPPPAPLSDDSWGGPPPGTMGQLRNGEPNGDGGGVMSPRASYTGFGHVESLWDDDGEQGENGEGMYRRDDRPGPAPGSSVAASSAGWGMGAGASCPSARGDGRGAGTLPGRMQSSSSPPVAAASLDTSGWNPRQEENGGHAGGRTAFSSGLPRSAGDIAGHFSEKQDMDRLGRPAFRGQGQDDPSSYLESLRRGGRGAEEWPGPGDRSAQRGGAHDADGAGDQGQYYSEHPRHDHDGTVAWEERPVERNAASQHSSREVRDAPEACREQPAGRDGSGGRVGAGVVEMRSTQDILSLFGGLEEDGDEHGSPGPSDAASRPEAARDALLPGGGGMPRAADMRHAQKESRAAAAVGWAAATAAAVGAAGLAGGVDPGTGPAAAASSGVVAGVAPPLEEWACGVCGVRGGASATSCRVCGAPRQGPTDDGFLGQGGGCGDHHGVVDGFSGSDHRDGWGGADLRGGEDWQEQEWDGVAQNRNAGGEAGGHDGLDGGGPAEGISLRGEEDVSAGRGHPDSSPVCSMPSRVGREGGAGGGVACSSGSVLRASSDQPPRMQIDVGSSSDSEDA